ncbi:zinc-dependent metalloprotease [Chryseobacterium sp. OV279]|uniref:zinc-dependent metalloprotease n=1 Tax=Chryseobacterium sp. OV279 TaxID=1500285 RepID=UPI0009193D59|nr:zinc-dependent metalloprotease [Chryseobacterium sp. OV279]SHF39162.1 Por secretion system C-terminal sorting domain-containing protein [Chryseobacterium sp. OV279]
MKKISIISGLLLFINIFFQAQEHYCGFDEELKRMDNRFPNLKTKREAVETKLRSIDKQSYFNKLGATTSWNGLYNGQVYEIPVVVHVIESQAPANANLSLTDQDVINWIDRANKMYATTYGNGFYPEGSGADGGNVIPFKLVLAKRSPACQPTSGIMRYNGSTISLYDTKGVKNVISSTNPGVGADASNIKTLAPHWPETSYFNIYVIIGFNGEQQRSDGLMGYARFPETYDYFYESFMKVATLKNQHDTTLTHELGHAFGLYHTFQGGDYKITSGNTGYCPPAGTGNCSLDNDLVCDTEVSGSAFFQHPAPANSQLNPCTGQNYQGVQYNIMNYSNTNRKFSEGQRDRAVLLMMEYRKNLLNSTAGKDPSVVIPSPVSLTPSFCNPLGIVNPLNNNFGIGATKVKFGSINSTTNGYDSDEQTPKFYEDYGSATCIRPAYYTDISSNSSTELKVSYDNGFQQADKFKTKVWIDYNNNGAFEDIEMIVNNSSVSAAPESTNEVINNITPPASAVKDTYLRMRVAVDALTFNDVVLPEITACSQLQYGQVEDYAIRITGVLRTSETKNISENKLVYIKSENKVKLMGSPMFGDYQIYDLSGQLIQKGNVKSDEIYFNRELPKGVFIIKYGDKNESKKILNN